MICNRRVCLGASVIAALTLLSASGGALGQARRLAAGGRGVGPSFVNGDVLVTVAHGTPEATVQKDIAPVNGTIFRFLGVIDSHKSIDCYQVKLPAGATAAETTNAITSLNNAGSVKAWPNKILSWHQASPGVGLNPNDTYFGKQWDLQQMQMPAAWTLQQGAANVVIADLDTGADLLNHPDFQGRTIFQPYNAVTATAGIAAVTPPPGNDHGTMTGGTACAVTNNATGIAGVAWQNVQFEPVLVGSEASGPVESAVISGLQYVMAQAAANGGLSFIVNLSFGGPAASVVPNPSALDPEETQIMAAANANIFFTIPAGNDFTAGNPPVSPAYLTQLSPNIMCVAATGDTGAIASYSEQQPYTDIAAPGGEFDAVGIFVMVQVADGSYATYNAASGIAGGTSHAAPEVAGVAALLLSTPGVTVGQLKALIKSTATPAGGANPNPAFGAGIVNAYAALSKVAVNLTILSPQGTGGKASVSTTPPAPIQTLAPTFKIQIGQVPPSNLTITLDNGTAIPQATAQQASTPYSTTSGPFYTAENVQKVETDASGNPIIGPDGNPIPLIYTAVIRNAVVTPGQHTVNVSGFPYLNGQTSTTPAQPDTRTFTVTPNQFPAGRSMVSFPYYQSSDASGDGPDPVSPQTYLGTGFQLSRWSARSSSYAFFTPTSPQMPDASFTPGLTDNPPLAPPHLDGTAPSASNARFPMGLGYFLDTDSVKPILTKGHSLESTAVIVPLAGNGSGSQQFYSWNMIGDPFPFNVPFNSLLVDTPNGRMSIQQAVTAGFILPDLYSFDPVNGYSFAALPSGTLTPWAGYWVAVTSGPDISLVVPPTGVTRAAPAPPAASATASVKGWQLQLSAHSGALHDNTNYIGMSAGAATGFNQFSVPKPPSLSPYVSLAIQHTDWGKRSSTYARDIQPQGGAVSWPVEVTTDQKQADITVAWNSAALPRTVRLMLKDNATGTVTDMRMKGGYTFNSGPNAATRSFTITATASTEAPATISDLDVRPTNGRAIGMAIDFTVTGEGTYDVKVLNSRGTPINTIATRAITTGSVSMVWNGRDQSGRPVASGMYLIQVRVTNTNGENVKALRPFQVIR